MAETSEIEAARQAMIAKRFGGQAAAQTGGKGTVRRKKKTASRSSNAESDRKLTAMIKKLGATNIPGIEEVNMFKEDGKVVHITNPKVQATIAANTYFVSGTTDTVPLESLLPGIVSQMGQEAIQALQQQVAAMSGMGAGAAGGAPAAGAEEEDSDDDDVPDLVEGQDFEAASNN
ncbi:hypothetical protein TeGR_g966 [Tetraparma gracilis]|jgi:nascent polypeptide-associated complex subunit beta|uniref:Nascent polypeptide-associated complex subunit beta n=1 Tax=Tetraparma gracilis TaxID=2962635 RepID=A0ABQ6N3H6_9STRA|nr:hypothetical protein TeGR_g966 [Tetraparma gracilis]